MLAPPPEAKYAQAFVELKKLELKAREMRGPDGEILGKHGVLALDFETSFEGRKLPSTIAGSGASAIPKDIDLPLIQISPQAVPSVSPIPFLPNVPSAETSAEASKAPARAAEAPFRLPTSSSEGEFVVQHSDEVMEKANRGEYPSQTQFVEPTPAKASRPLSTKRLKRNNKRKVGRR